MSGNSNGTLSAGALPPCAHNAGGGTNTSSTAVTSNSDDITCGPGIYCGTRSDAPLAVAPINAHNTCYWIDNSSTQAVFVPFKSSSEWGSFLSNLPSGVTKTPCAKPGYYVDGGTTHTSGEAVNVTPYPNSNCSSQPINIPTVYGRAGSPMGAWPTPALSPSFTCNNGGTTIQSSLQWTANYQSDPRYWAESFHFSPNLTLTATDTNDPTQTGTDITITPGDTVKLTWTDPQAGAHTPSGNWNGTQGATVKPTVDTTYTLSSTSGGLTSIATVNVHVTAVVAGACGTDNGQTMLTTPTNLCAANNTVSTSLAANGGKTGWTWACTPTAGGTATNCAASLTGAACGANVQTDGNGNITSGTPCTSGTAGSVDASGNYTCTTSASGASNNASCRATITSVVPVCGSMANTYQDTLQPTSPNLCGSGTMINFDGAVWGSWTWQCSGGKGQAAVSCQTHPCMRNGSSCGGGACPDFSAQGYNITQQSIAMCGPQDNIKDYFCEYYAGGLSTCTMPPAACGSAAGGTYPSNAPPTTNLCASGIVMKGVNADPGVGLATDPQTGQPIQNKWAWSCYGGGAYPTCFANRTVTTLPVINGSCGPATNIAYTQRPIYFTCNSGLDPNTIPQGDPLSYITELNGKWNWTCYGQNGGSDATCSAPDWSTFHWVQSPFSACTASCGGGTTTATFSCQNTNGAVVDPSNCSQPAPANITNACNTQACVPVDGVCSPQSDGLCGCVSGKYQFDSYTGGNKNWECLGIDGGNFVLCHAPKLSCM